MYWEVMERAREKGCRLFDYGRSKRGTGAFDFKTYWGFEPQPLYYEYFLVRRKEMPNLSPTNPKYGKAIELWRKLPLKLTQLIGPPIAKYLGLASTMCGIYGIISLAGGARRSPGRPEAHGRCDPASRPGRLRFVCRWRDAAGHAPPCDHRRRRRSPAHCERRRADRRGLQWRDLQFSRIAQATCRPRDTGSPRTATAKWPCTRTKNTATRSSSKLDGMFGLALWDRRRRRLIVARDAIGIKPIYYRQDAAELVFASEAKAILALPGISARLDPNALAQYLSVGYVCAPNSIFEGMQKLRARHRAHRRERQSTQAQVLPAAGSHRSHADRVAVGRGRACRTRALGA